MKDGRSEVKVWSDSDEKERIKSLPFRLNPNITALLDFYKWAVKNKNTSAVILTDGKSGFGKSTLTFQIGEYCDTNGFSLKKVHFNPQTFLEGSDDKIGLTQAQPGDVIVFDEGMLLSNRSAMTSINRMVIQAMSMIRSKRIIVVFNVNSIFDLDRNLTLSRADILFHLYGDHLVDRGKVMAFFRGEDGRDRLKELYLKGKKFYDYSQPKSNFNTTFSAHFPFDEEVYEIDKQKGVNEFLKGLGKESNAKTKNSRDACLWWIRNNTNKTIEEIADIANLSRSQAYLLFKTAPLAELAPQKPQKASHS